MEQKFPYLNQYIKETYKNLKFENYLIEKEEILSFILDKFSLVDKNQVNDIFLLNFLYQQIEKNIKEKSIGFVKSKISNNGIVIMFHYKYAYSTIVLETAALTLSVKSEQVLINKMSDFKSGFVVKDRFSFFNNDKIDGISNLLIEEGNAFFNSRTKKNNLMKFIKNIDSRIEATINEMIKDSMFRKVKIIKKESLYDQNSIIAENNGFTFNLDFNDFVIEKEKFKNVVFESEFFDIIREEILLQEKIERIKFEKANIFNNAKISDKNKKVVVKKRI